MHIHILSVCQKVPAWVSEGFSTYEKRLPKEISLSLKAIPTPSRSANSVANCLELEAKRLEAAIPKHSYIIALDERGPIWDTLRLADKVHHWQMQGQSHLFINWWTRRLQIRLFAHKPMKLGHCLNSLCHTL